MKDITVRQILCRLNNSYRVKESVVLLHCNKMNYFIAKFLAKEGYSRGFFLSHNNHLKKRLCIILKYSYEDQNCISDFASKKFISRRSKFSKKNNLLKYINGLGVMLSYTIHGFVSNDYLFWFKLGGKVLFSLK